LRSAQISDILASAAEVTTSSVFAALVVDLTPLSDPDVGQPVRRLVVRRCGATSFPAIELGSRDEFPSTIAQQSLPSGMISTESSNFQNFV
jgi:hypothetical protein